jgi:hypothetical protein
VSGNDSCVNYAPYTTPRMPGPFVDWFKNHARLRTFYRFSQSYPRTGFSEKM